MTRLLVGVVVGAAVALALGAATEPEVRKRMRWLARELGTCGCYGRAEGQPLRIDDVVSSGKQILQAAKERYRAAVEESRAAAADERRRLWSRFEQARDTGRADVGGDAR